MCGISGIWRKDGKPVDSEALARMNGVLRHRGPDGDEILAHESCGFAHRRLTILDLSDSASQPMRSPDGRFWITFNGEIHNYRELRDQLRARGHQFRSTGDTEVFLAAYQIWREECFEHFNGMWAAAIWDAQARQLILSRDRFGIKPLFYYSTNSLVCFASEAKAILTAFPEETQVNEKVLCQFLLGANPDSGEETFYRHIKAVKPSHFIRFERTSVQEGSYWELDPQNELTIDETQAASALKDLLSDSVQLRLRSDVPLGLCVSGGLDSSSVACLSSSFSEDRFHSFSLKYSDQPQIDESSYAAEVFSNGGFEPHWVTPRADRLIEEIGKIVWHLDAPPPVRGRLGQWALFREAQKYVKVLLVGEGGDELLGGYNRFFVPHHLDLIRGLFSGRGLTHLDELRAAFKGWRRISPGWVRLLTEIARPLAKKFSLLGFTERSFIDRNFLESFKTQVVPASFYHSWWNKDVDRPFASKLNNALWQEFRFCLPELLRSEDALGMAHSIEVRPPFLDHRIVEFCFALSQYKIQAGKTKALLRRAMTGLVPESILNRTDKVGMPTPYHSFFTSEPNFTAITELLLGGKAVDEKILNREGLRRLLQRYRTGNTPSARANLMPLWKCICLELWLKQLRNGVLEKPTAS